MRVLHPLLSRPRRPSALWSLPSSDLPGAAWALFGNEDLCLHRLRGVGNPAPVPYLSWPFAANRGPESRILTHGCWCQFLSRCSFFCDFLEGGSPPRELHSRITRWQVWGSKFLNGIHSQPSLEGEDWARRGSEVEERPPHVLWMEKFYQEILHLLAALVVVGNIHLPIACTSERRRMP